MRALISITLWTLTLVTVRLEWSDSPRYQWLYWDLFLALVPLGIAMVYERLRAWPLLIPWLLFFPNAPYLLTEFIHLRIPDTAPHWLDIAMLVSVAATGILAGAMSLQRVLPQRRRLFWELTVCALCGFGIYLGRYERWNSWDVLTAPLGLFSDLIRYVAHPVAHQHVWLSSAVFAGCVFFLQRCVQKQN